MALKYHYIMNKNLKLVIKKKGQELAYKTINGWRYQSTLDKASR